MKTRDSLIDIMKGICIILMVAGHSKFPLQHFIYLFHMAVFYIISGSLFNPERIENKTSLFKFIKRKFRTLWFPFFLYNCIFIFLNNIFINLNLYISDYRLAEQYGFADSVENYLTMKGEIVEIIKCIFLIGGTQMSAALWFFRSLLMVSVLFAIIEYVLIKINSKNKSFNLVLQGIIALILLICGYIIQKAAIPNTYSIGNCFSVYILYFAGYLISMLNLSEFINKHILINIIFSVAVLIICNKLGRIDLDVNYYSNPLFFVIVSISGYILIYSISYFVKNLKFSGFITYIGRNTIPIMVLHFLCFKFINFICTIYYELPIELTGAFPVLIDKGLWWILYTILGVSLPLLIDFAIKKILNNLKGHKAI